MKRFSKLVNFPRPEDSLRAVAECAPQAEEFAARCIGRVRPLATHVYGLRRRLATIAVTVLAALLFVHVMLGANGMVVYKQKRAEYQALRRQIEQVQQENDRYTSHVEALKSSQTAVEKEAREQLGYARPGEYVYVAPPKPTPPANHTAKK